MLSPKVFETILDAALSQGGDFAEVYCERSHFSSLSMINRITERAMAGIAQGIGIRILDGPRSVYVYANTTEENKLIDLAVTASKSLQKSRGDKPKALSALCIHEPTYVKIMPDTQSQDQKKALIEAASAAASDVDKKITQTAAGYADINKEVWLANSEGLFVFDRRVRTRMTIEAIASSATEKQSGYFGPGMGVGFEYWKNYPIEDKAREAARIALTMLNAKPCPSGSMPVVVGHGFGGVIFHEACGHALESSSVGIKASVFTDKLNKKIASSVVTAIDDATIEGQWGSFAVDDEGMPAKRKILIENGVLKNYMIDRIGARRMNAKPNGSGRRQNYTYAPTSRMSNTYIAAGKDSVESIIADTPYGLFAKHMGGGSVDPATGEFNFAVTEAYMIRNGQLAEPVRGATLIGKGADVLMAIDRVANDLVLTPGICGAASGHVPTCVGQPTLRVAKMTVGGTDHS